MKKLSIIIPSYNRRCDLERCLNSVLPQCNNSCEVIVINDGSTDETYNFLLSFNHSCLKIINYKINQGVNYARNKGISSASGKFVMFLDSDDMLLENALEIIFTYITTYQDINHFLFAVSSNPLPSNSKESFTAEYTDWLLEKIEGDFAHVLLRDFFNFYPFFEEFRAFENLNWLRIFKASAKQLVINKFVFWIDTQRTDNLTKTLRLQSNKAIKAKFQSMFLYFDLFGNDLLLKNKFLFKKKLNYTLFLGVASKEKKDVLKLIKRFTKDYVFLKKAIVYVASPWIACFIIQLKSRLI